MCTEEPNDKFKMRMHASVQSGKRLPNSWKWESRMRSLYACKMRAFISNSNLQYLLFILGLVYTHYSIGSYNWMEQCYSISFNRIIMNECSNYTFPIFNNSCTTIFTSFLLEIEFSMIPHELLLLFFCRRRRRPLVPFMEQQIVKVFELTSTILIA